VGVRCRPRIQGKFFSFQRLLQKHVFLKSTINRGESVKWYAQVTNYSQNIKSINILRCKTIRTAVDLNKSKQGEFRTSKKKSSEAAWAY